MAGKIEMYFLINHSAQIKFASLLFDNKFIYILGIGGLGIGDWGIGDWGLGPNPHPQSPIPNPQSPHLE